MKLSTVGHFKCGLNMKNALRSLGVQCPWASKKTGVQMEGYGKV